MTKKEFVNMIDEAVIILYKPRTEGLCKVINVLVSRKIISWQAGLKINRAARRYFNDNGFPYYLGARCCAKDNRAGVLYLLREIMLEDKSYKRL